MLRLVDLRKSFGTVRAVDGLSLEVRSGEVFGLLGPNGAGKSTTIGMAIGLLRPDEGSVELVGVGSPHDPEVRRKIGLAPQAIALYEDMSGLENLEFFARLYELPDAKRRANEVLELVGLSQRARDHVAGYSGGMQRRLNLAVALLHDPPLLMLDEPTAGVDPQSRNSILELVRNLAKEGRTVLYTTHYMEEAQRLCDRVGVLDNGKLLDVGTVEELIGRHGGHTAVIVERERDDGSISEDRVVTGEPLREIAGAVASSDVRGVRIERPTLESVFLHLTGRSLRD
ncbi:MAG: ABC transporter ATP-binding protein [Phycisphaerales bacterium]